MTTQICIVLDNEHKLSNMQFNKQVMAISWVVRLNEEIIHEL